MLKTRLQAFGSSCQVTLHAGAGDGEELLDLVAAELERIESKFSSHSPESVVSSINRTAGTEYVNPLDAEARSLFQFVSALWSESKHLFDPTTRLLENCYSPEGRLQATPSQVAGLLKLVGWGKVEITDAGARMLQEGMLIDLDSCIRPYAMDCVRKILLANDVRHACVEMDRDAVTIGKQPDGSNWLFGIRHPYGHRTAITRVKLNNRGFASRGDFERRISFEGETYSRGLSPIDGYPVPGLLNVSVVADSCLAACSAASVARLRTEQAGINWLEKLGLPWMAIGRDLQCHGPLAPE